MYLNDINDVTKQYVEDNIFNFISTIDNAIALKQEVVKPKESIDDKAPIKQLEKVIEKEKNSKMIIDAINGADIITGATGAIVSEQNQGG